VLTLDANGIPHRWVSWQHAVFYQAKDLVAWVAGSHEFEIRGGINRVTGEQSSIRTNSIIAIKGRSHAHKLQAAVPPLNNRELFYRDRSVCAYCGSDFSYQKLTRDHIVPVSQGGRDLWMNVVTCCRPVQSAQERAHAGAGAHAAAVRTLRAEQGRVPDPQQPEHPR
jgi:5-methylcytosine-specific restriction endonuclease McrA